MKKLKRLICAISVLALLFTCAPLTFAEEENPFSGEFSEYRGSDGSVTKVYDNGSVTTEYSDGTKAAVDYNGCRYTKDNDGTQTVYDIDGTVAKEYPDGTQELLNPDGTTEKYFTDGSSITEFTSGLCEKTNPDGTSAMYFEGGEGMLKNDGSGYEYGTISGPNGEILSSGAKGIDMISKEGTKYNCSYNEDGEDTVKIERTDGTGFETFADGTGVYKIDGAEAKVDLGGNMYWTFEDGGNATFTNGVMKITATDGSYQIKDSKSEYFETFNAQNGSHMVINNDGEVEKLKLNADGFKFDYSDGKLNLLQDDESGLIIVMSGDGSGKVFSPDKNYEISAKGNVTVKDRDTEKTSAKKTDKAGTWVFVQMDTGYMRESYADGTDSEQYKVEELKHESVFEYYLTSNTQHAEFVSTCERPPESFKGGEILSLKASIRCSNGDTEFFTDVASYCQAYEDSDPYELQGSYYFRTEDNDFQIQAYAHGEKRSEEATFTKEMPEGFKNGDRIALFFVSSGCFTRWVYEWAE